MLFEALFGGSQKKHAEALYRSAAEQTRTPAFYRGLGVPDTVDGRFDLLVLHVLLLLRRLRREGEPGRRLSQRVFDAMFDHLDQALREMGVGDLSVGRKIKAMGQAVYGRAAAYDRALEEDPSSLADVLARNLFATAPADKALAALVGYVMGAESALAAQPGRALLEGRAVFPPVPGA